VRIERLSSIIKKVSKVFNTTAVNFAVENTNLPGLCMEAALAYLSVIDPEAFEIALTAATPADDQTHEDDEAISACRRAAAWSGSSSTAACNGSATRATASPPAPRPSAGSRDVMV
jgi:hypothetical protein